MFVNTRYKNNLQALKSIFTSLLIYSAFQGNSYADSFFQGSISPIPLELQHEMIGKTWHSGCPVSFNDLAYLRLSYWGFDNKSHIGELIVNQQFATEVLDIFKQLYDNHFPIEKMVIPERLFKDKKFVNAMDFLINLVNSDDTYAFFCRIDTQTNSKPSDHGFGIAIDINPFYNPAVINNAKSNPALNAEQQAGFQYLDRKLNHMGMIKENDTAFRIFLNHGWIWGGFFTEGVDYMHFQKSITPYYTINKIQYNPPSKRIKGLRD